LARNGKPGASLLTPSSNQLPRPARKAGFSTFESRSGRETDCLLEGDGFEPSVPRQESRRFRDTSPASHDGFTVSRPGTDSSNPSSSSGESDANLTTSIRDIATVTEGAALQRVADPAVPDLLGWKAHA
jgi:hypothetical protein